MTSKTTQEVCDRFAALIEAGTDLTETVELLSVRHAPEVGLHRHFCVIPREQRNARIYRDQPGEQQRDRYIITVICAWMGVVHNYSTTRNLAFSDVDALIVSVKDDTQTQGAWWPIHDLTTYDIEDQSREWLFATVSFELQTDRRLR